MWEKNCSYKWHDGEYDKRVVHNEERTFGRSLFFFLGPLSRQSSLVLSSGWEEASKSSRFNRSIQSVRACDRQTDRQKCCSIYRALRERCAIRILTWDVRVTFLHSTVCGTNEFRTIRDAHRPCSAHNPSPERSIDPDRALAVFEENDRFTTVVITDQQAY